MVLTKIHFLSLLALLGASCRPFADNQTVARSKSLTGKDFKGKKFYLGWGAASANDPSMMHNEVKYDVLHTSNVFTKELGGSYIGKTIFGREVGRNSVQKEWGNIKGSMTSDDMFVQYSSGHGMPSGLAVGLSWADMTKNILDMPSKETIVFTMACFSGNFVNTINKQKDKWIGRPKEGRTLFVMASSRAEETSSTGPGTSSFQQGPNGSAGSAYGHALWRALAGESDGYIDGIVDGYLTLEEISAFTIDRTVRLGGHTPQVTGAWSPGLVMSRVPVAGSVAEASSL